MAATSSVTGEIAAVPAISSPAASLLVSKHSKYRRPTGERSKTTAGRRSPRAASRWASSTGSSSNDPT